MVKKFSFYFPAGNKESMIADTLDPKVRKDLKQQLKLNFKQISKQYGSYASYIRKSVIKRGVKSWRIVCIFARIASFEVGRE